MLLLGAPLTRTLNDNKRLLIDHQAVLHLGGNQHFQAIRNRSGVRERLEVSLHPNE